MELAPGLLYYPSFLESARQHELLREIEAVIAVAPLFQPRMPRTGTPFSVTMTNSGTLGWVADRDGYRYTDRHPTTLQPWPAIPDIAADTWRRLSRFEQPAEACLINYYASEARMGLHQDRDEDEFEAPVVSLSLGDTCIFRFGGKTRRDPTRSIKLASGDALVIGGASRLAFHGVDRLLAGSSSLLPQGGRYNLTLRRVTRVEPP